MAHPLPSEQYPLSVHFDVLRRFMSVSRNGTEPVAPSSVEGASLPSGAAQLNVAFLADVGLLIEEAAGRFKPTPVAMQLINTQSIDADRGRRLLRSLVGKMWFGRTAEALRRSNPRVTVSEIRSRITEEAAGTTPAEPRAVELLLEYLRYTELLGHEDPAALPTVPPRASDPASADSRTGPSSSGPSIGRSTGAEWKTIRTDDFELSIRADHDAVRRLRRHLDLLDEEIPSDRVRRRQ